MNEKLTLLVFAFKLEESAEELDFCSPVLLDCGSPNLTGAKEDSEEKEGFPIPEKQKVKLLIK